MAVYTLVLTGLQTGGTANSFTTIAGIKLGGAAGSRARLRSLEVSGGGGAAQDVQVTLKGFRHTSNGSNDGTPGSSPNVNTVGKNNPNSVASNVSSIGINYSAEPQALDTGPCCGGGLNSRGTFIKEYDIVTAPEWNKDQILCLQASPGSATQVNLTATFVIEEF